MNINLQNVSCIYNYNLFSRPHMVLHNVQFSCPFFLTVHQVKKSGKVFIIYILSLDITLMQKKEFDHGSPPLTGSIYEYPFCVLYC